MVDLGALAGDRILHSQAKYGFFGDSGEDISICLGKFGIPEHNGVGIYRIVGLCTEGVLKLAENPFRDVIVKPFFDQAEGILSGLHQTIE